MPIQRLQTGHIDNRLVGARQTRVRFQAGPASPLSAESPPPPPQKKRWWHRVLMISPLANLLGGALLVGSAVMPSASADPARKTLDPPVAQVQSAEMPFTVGRILPQDGWDLQQVLRQLGWTFSSLGLLTGSINGLALGVHARQPSMALAAVGSMIASPLLVVDPSLSVRAAMLFFAGPWLAGMGNKIQNEFNAAQGREDFRSHDIKPLLSLKALRAKHQAMAQDPEADPSTLALLKLWGQEAGQSLSFIVGDQWLLLKNTGRLAGRTILAPRQTCQGLREGARGLKDFLKGNRTDLPEAIQPSATQSHVGAMLVYSGSVPLLFVGGPETAVAEVCTKLAALGGAVAESALWLTAVQQRDKMLLVGIPLRTGGSAWMHTDAGMGVSLLGRAMVQQYFRHQVVSGAHSVPETRSEPLSGVEPQEKILRP